MGSGKAIRPLPANLPSVAKATLPVQYVAAREALAQCSKIDECRSWADKAAAMASYAKQADDDSMFKMASKIHARAVTRCGELLKSFSPSEKPGRKKNCGSNPTISRSQAAKDAGLSRDQKVQALRLANIPKDEFEGLIESDNPPTITQLAERGKKVDMLQGRSPKDFQLMMSVASRISALVKVTNGADPSAVVRGIKLDSQREKITESSRQLSGWLALLIKELKK